MRGADADPGSTPGPGDHLYFDGARLIMLDQTLLPGSEVRLALSTAGEVAGAIRRLAVRGAMAIGVAAAYGVVLEALRAPGGEAGGVIPAARAGIEALAASRPTARNLFWALERMSGALDRGASMSPGELVASLRSEADLIAAETILTNRTLVAAGLEVVPRGARILTHCNSGPLAALRYGTAVGVIIEAHRSGREVSAWVDETRPLLQGARLTTWELGRAGVPYTLIPDGASAVLMGRGDVDLVVTGADRIAANGDTANKIGTYALAVLADAHGIPFYIAAPGSTVDLSCPDGAGIVIEERDPEEVTVFGGRRVAPEGARVFNPSFDVTPAEYISGIITEAGVLRPPYPESLTALA